MKNKKTSPRSYHHFTSQEKQFIRRHYATTRTCCIAHVLGLTTQQVKDFARRQRIDRDKVIDVVWNKTLLKQSEINTSNRARGAAARDCELAGKG